ncbi:L,D-transpeptidase family protein [Oricola cellulosilytica]|uniref:Murein L,D-transpeptidase n=1 Tax=Oricola cellulosilytica TaxID=1429082 RepID=A0A4R0PD06_9HYPH|nr:L,D-transpeptidase [Oricola cellulosilytica]TCD15361.1 murein L,D-transpeptidase [Oricola cellulosilytica]
MKNTTRTLLCFTTCLVATGLSLTTLQASQSPIEPGQVNDATYDGGPLPDGQSPLTAKVQILLDRAAVSPGVIDGYGGESVEKAIRAFETINGLPVDGTMDEEVWSALQANTGDTIVSYTITEEDLTDIVEPLPEDYAELAELDWLGYTQVDEKLAERFHMDVEFLHALNPGADFASPGAQIWVADPGEDAEVDVARIVADKSLSRLLVYDSADKLVLSYPVTIGSEQTPSPSGTHEVVAVAIEPTYSYNPDKNFQQGDNDEPLTLPPGPNGPVGLVWIDLSKPTYGLHGTPEPAEIGKTSSHGCVRMTNWDASELAHLVSSGIEVSFED